MEQPLYYHATNHSMKRRCDSHDYHARCMYMITLVVEGRRNVFGRLVGDPFLSVGQVGAASLEPSLLGRAVEEAWKDLPRRYPEVNNIALQLMPDHLHFIVFVTKRMEVALPTVIASFEGYCRQRYKALIRQGLAPAVPQYISEEQSLAKKEGRKSGLGLLFEIGYNDKILWREGELQLWKQYLADNPRRRLIKERCPELFMVKRNVDSHGFTFEALGNVFLLDYPRRIYVQCSRRISDSDLAALLHKAKPDFENGSVFVSASVSPGEKLVMRRAFESGCPTIVLRENGFAQYEKPHGKAFDACAEGKLLLLAPWEHHTEKRLISREQCLYLNRMALAISTDRL